MKIGIIGAGVMGEVITDALTLKEVFAPEDIMLSDIGRGRLDGLEKRFGVQTTMENEELLDHSDVVVICVKPQNAEPVLRPLKGRFRPDQLLISIMAGVSSDTLARLTGHECIVRSMPNIPARIGQGMTVWTASGSVSDHFAMVAKMIFQAFGRELQLDEENMVDAATAVSGSGPAYLFYVAENLVKSGVELGFTEAQSHRLVEQTILGAMNLWSTSGEKASALRQNVTSRGGTTEAALKTFQKHNTPEIFVDALQSAYKRAKELRKLVDESVGETKETPKSTKKKG